MTIGDHLREWGGLPAYTFPDPEKDAENQAAAVRSLPAADSVAWRIAVDSYEAPESWEDAFARFLDTVDPGAVRAIIVGSWTDAYENRPDGAIEAIVAAREQLPALRAVFVGDIIGEECEISWINQGEVTRLLEAFPALEELGVRGGERLEFTTVRHESLRKLTVEAGGLPVTVVRGVAASELPALVDLELWLGTSEYGGDSDVDDLAPILSGDRLPSLKRLALRNSEIQDVICAAVASAPVVARLDELDLSMGVLTDDGVAALLGGQPLTHLTSLDLHHNYVSSELGARLTDTLTAAGVELNLAVDDADEDEDDDGSVWRFVAVGE
ncbi:cytoplasmic protein [Nocardia mangyaensis]|uniref:Cytoplasmic protein n=1 Tax=Nocardia mangyaensis TaxID=2213200 RepID=A0A1J0VT23_9NOCA|nr:STM4015 family protein [Nocardia mangyaensis]APE35188.1 cytoplasmic protein [Nocardia mangyaensis]